MPYFSSLILLLLEKYFPFILGTCSGNLTKKSLNVKIVESDIQASIFYKKCMCYMTFCIFNHIAPCFKSKTMSKMTPKIPKLKQQNLAKTLSPTRIREE